MFLLFKNKLFDDSQNKLLFQKDIKNFKYFFFDEIKQNLKLFFNLQN